MKKDINVTEVIFRKFKDSEIIALFPYEICDGQGNNTSYMNTGQHGAADYFHVLDRTKPAVKKEYSDLLKELEGIGYNLRIMKKRSFAKYINSWQAQKNIKNLTE